VGTFLKEDAIKVAASKKAEKGRGYGDYLFE
jgi:hypothetical protein